MFKRWNWLVASAWLISSSLAAAEPNETTKDFPEDGSHPTESAPALTAPVPDADVPAEPPPALPPADEPAPAPTAPAAPSPSSVWTEKNLDQRQDVDERPRAGTHKNWTVFAAAAHETLVGDDFEGTTLLVGPTPSGGAQVVLVPKLQSGTGFLLGAGVGGMPQRAGLWGFWLDLTYSAVWLRPQVALVDMQLDASVLHQFHPSLRLLYRPSRLFAPFIEVAVGSAWFSVDGIHGNYDPVSENVTFDSASSSFSGASLSIGVGSTFFPTETLTIEAFVGYRSYTVLSVNGIELDDGLNAGGWLLRLGPTLYL